MLTEHTKLIRSLIDSFINYRDQLRIETSGRNGTTYFMMQCHADDHSKMVGKLGSHFHALRLIIAELGRQAGQDYKLCRYQEPTTGIRSDRSEIKPAETYDPAAACTLLDAIFACVCSGQYAIHAAAPTIVDQRLSYQLTITTRELEDYAALTRYASGSDPIPENAEAPMTIIGAIGTLFRAYANRDGVRFSVQLKRP